MAKKQKRSGSEGDQQPKLSRKHITRAEKEAKQRQQIMMATSILGVSIVVILLLGALHAIFIEPAQAMAEVNGEEISRREFYQRVNYERFRIYEAIVDSREQAEELMSDPQTGRMFMQYFQQQLGQLQAAYSAIGSQSLEQMIEERVLEEKAAQRDVTVSDEEVSEEIRREIARKEEALIEVDVEATATAQAGATATALLFTPTPTLEPSPTPTDTLESDATTIIEPEATNTPAPTSTPNILSDSLYDDAYGQFLAQLEKDVGYTDADYREVIQNQLLREKMQELIGGEAEVETTGPHVHAAHILVETEEEAQAVVDRLNGGEEFAEVAAEVSTDGSAENGGDLGWFGQGQMVPVFEEAAFALTEPDQVSDIVQSDFGFHIIQLLEAPEERELPETQVQQARDDAFREYLTEAKTQSSIRRYWDLDDLPSDPFIEEIAKPLPTLPPLEAPAVPDVPSETDSLPAEEEEGQPAEESAPEESESSSE